MERTKKPGLALLHKTGPGAKKKAGHLTWAAFSILIYAFSAFVASARYRLLPLAFMKKSLSYVLRCWLFLTTFTVTAQNEIQTRPSQLSIDSVGLEAIDSVGLEVIGLEGSSVWACFSETVIQEKILRNAPIVFLGSPVADGTDAIYQDKQGHFYYTRLLKVMQVLRGHKVLHSGFVELVDSIPAHVSLTVLPDLSKSPAHAANWGVYFCTAANWPKTLPSYKGNKRQRVQLFQGLQQAQITSQNTPHGHIIGGLFQQFANEDKVKKFLAAIPDLSPVKKDLAK
jgi:hypothetical protein